MALDNELRDQDIVIALKDDGSVELYIIGDNINEMLSILAKEHGQIYIKFDFWGDGVKLIAPNKEQTPVE